MTQPPAPLSREGRPTREDRLATKLRENLHRRKAQARLQGDSAGNADNASDSALPKAPAKS